MKNGRLYTVTYDIPNDSRRIKLANLLKSYGERVQLSVFECWLEAAELEELKQRASRLVQTAEDSVRFYRIGGSVDVLGLGLSTADRAFVIV